MTTPLPDIPLETIVGGRTGPAGYAGRVPARHEPKTPPDAPVSDIEEELEAFSPADAGASCAAEPARSAA